MRRRAKPGASRRRNYDKEVWGSGRERLVCAGYATVTASAPPRGPVAGILHFEGKLLLTRGAYEPFCAEENEWYGGHCKPSNPRKTPRKTSPGPSPASPKRYFTNTQPARPVPFRKRRQSLLPKPKKYFMSTRQVCMTGVYRYSLKHAIESNIRYTLAPLSGIRVELDDRVRQNV